MGCLVLCVFIFQEICFMFPVLNALSVFISPLVFLATYMKLYCGGIILNFLISGKVLEI